MKKARTGTVTQQTKSTTNRVAILQASWHQEHTNRMVEACEEYLNSAGVGQIEKFQVPGAYEIPLAAKLLAKKKKFDAIVVFGAIVKGDTDHYQVILDTCIRELGKVMYDFEVPIIMEILPVHKLGDLIERSRGRFNKGREAGEACVKFLDWLEENR
jgi:6,7-dimethyl-8-ribityllumazine synthase